MKKNNVIKLALYSVVIAMSSLSIVFLILGKISNDYNIFLIVLPLAIGMLCIVGLGISSIR